MDEPFAILRDASFTAPGPGGEPDPEFADWLGGKGLYATNGAVIALITRSRDTRREPDLYMFAVPGCFAGYEPGYSERTKSDKNYFTWVILKAHTNNTAGYVRLRSRDPWDTPDINFRYFDDGNDSAREDLDSVVAGIRQVREITARTPGLMTEELPGANAKTDDELREFVKCHAWGHHACGTCRIGADGDPDAVLDSRFRVRKTKGLRVVDASVFPRIPGFFILSAVYMIAEKASDAILEDARG
jgi:choline dehydrogenase